MRVEESRCVRFQTTVVGKSERFPDSRIQWLLSISPDCHRLWGTKAMGSSLRPVVLSNSLMETVVTSVGGSWPEACPFLQTHPKQPFLSCSKYSFKLQQWIPPAWTPVVCDRWPGSLRRHGRGWSDEDQPKHRGGNGRVPEDHHIGPQATAQVPLERVWTLGVVGFFSFFPPSKLVCVFAHIKMITIFLPCVLDLNYTFNLPFNHFN